MRAYLTFKNCKEKFTVDCITLSKENDTLHLSFNEQDYSFENGEGNIRLKDEESATFGLPDCLEDCYGNNDKTFDFIKECTIESIVLYPEDEDVGLCLDSISLDKMRICVGEKYIEYYAAELKEHPACIEGGK